MCLNATTATRVTCAEADSPIALWSVSCASRAMQSRYLSRNSTLIETAAPTDAEAGVRSVLLAAITHRRHGRPPWTYCECPGLEALPTHLELTGLRPIPMATLDRQSQISRSACSSRHFGLSKKGANLFAHRGFPFRGRNRPERIVMLHVSIDVFAILEAPAGQIGRAHV